MHLINLYYNISIFINIYIHARVNVYEFDINIYNFVVITVLTKLYEFNAGICLRERVDWKPAK